MDKITIEKLDPEELEHRGILSWPIWEKEPSTFDWHYDEQETCYILEGEIRVEPKNGKPVDIRPGDFVTFPEGMDCVWKISKGVRKHFNFG